MIEHKLSDCLRQVRDQFAPYCEHGVTMPADAVRDVVSHLSIFATAAERLEGVTFEKSVGEIITLRADEYRRTVPVEVVGGIS
ncbi:hypothetical protein CXZ10_06000 [Pleomorphomonas diazotrophica]|uniref:Uncharacterized protein n=1 Tax=Pleomorphomonas diazotrophica TaxID=1166257 RepID=A0A1I4Q6P8_9HYPH|nr:hypothetical protein [Pleomorphomonas diazotrophica]PKR90897.1 hypothetical protein CXZ10_06000 [Pleomorphomonas diazotrophica]SFM35724.1 hypothetical protein SAMN05192571_101111 [Pleomorphomonas diazotrophica]